MVLVVAVADKVGWIRGIDSVRQRVVVEIIVLNEQTRRGLGSTVLGVGKDAVATVTDFAATHREIMRPFNVDAASKAVPKMLHARFVRKSYAAIAREERIADVEVFDVDEADVKSAIDITRGTWTDDDDADLGEDGCSPVSGRIFNRAVAIEDW